MRVGDVYDRRVTMTVSDRKVVIGVADDKRPFDGDRARRIRLGTLISRAHCARWRNGMVSLYDLRHLDARNARDLFEH